MPDYLQIEFEDLSNEQRDVLIALLAEINYDGFEEEGDLLRAYIAKDNYDESQLKTIAHEFQLSYFISTLHDTNWNRNWESNFDPVIIHRQGESIPFVGVRAQFHAPLSNVQYEIVITPKMSFGTGHHATTGMMMNMMGELDLKRKKVLDFGTGTGILAILANKLGASEVVAVDIDDHSIANAAENFDSNDCREIELYQASSAQLGRSFDVILSNIIKQVILENLSSFAEQLVPGGALVLSGLLEDDEQEILASAIKYNFEVAKKIKVDSWICLQMVYKPTISDD